MSAKNDISFEEFVHELPIGIVLINNDNHILLANKKAEQLLCKDKQPLTRKKLQTLLVEAKNVEVRQLRRVVKQVDYAIETNQKIVTQYSPFIGADQKLQGVQLLLQSLDDFNEMVSDFTKLDYWRTAMNKIAHFPGKSFRIVNKAGKEDVVSKDWKQVIQRVDYLQAYAIDQFHHVMKKRRTDQQTVYTGPITNEEMILTTEPIFHNGKIAGCLQEIEVHHLESNMQRNLDSMKKLIRKLEGNYRVEDIVGRSTDIQLVKEQVKLYIQTGQPIYITGEKGTGKRMLAKSIHHESTYRYDSFLSFDCGKGNFSLEQIDHYLATVKKGTVYFYNIIQRDLPAKLLEHLSKYNDLQIIFSSTDNKLLHDVKNHIYLSPLRERKEDIPLLAAYFVQLFNLEYDGNIQSIDENLINKWKEYDWPGNIMELEKTINEIMQSMPVDEQRLTDKDKSLLQTNTEKISNDLSLQEAVEQYERQFIIQSLKECQFNKTKTAKLLGISIRNLYYKMDKYQIDGGD